MTYWLTGVIDCIYATYVYIYMNDNFQAMLKLSHNSYTFILDKVWHVAIATNGHLSFTYYPVGLLCN